MALILILYNQPDRFHRLFPAVVFDIFKGEHDHRIFSLQGTVFIAALPDLFIGKISGGIFVCLLEECFDCIDSQCFAKAARTGKQCDHVMVIDQIPDQKSLIHIIAFTGYFNI